MNLKYRTSCRICGNPNLVEVIDLGNQWLQGSFEKGDLPVCRRKVPSKLVRCDTSKQEESCGLVQTACTVPPSIMYANYFYLSGTSKTMRNHLKDIVDLALEKTSDKIDVCAVLDIASNDNSLLKSYPTDRDIKRYGVDPSDISKAQQGTQEITNIHDFFPSRQLTGLQFDIITSIAMVYDLDDPNFFVKEIKKSLRSNGLWCFEMAYLPFILDNLCFDTFCFPPNTSVLGDRNFISEYQVGDSVIDAHGEKTSVTKVHKRDYVGKLIKFKTRLLESIECTSEHPFLVVDKSEYRFPAGGYRKNWKDAKPKWKKAEDIELSDLVILPKTKELYQDRVLDLSSYRDMSNKNSNKSIESVELTKELAYIMGLFVAEGHCNFGNNCITFTLHIEEQDLLKKIREYFETIDYKTSVFESQVLYKGRRSKSMEARISCASLTRAFREWFGYKAKNKYIPDFIFFNTSEIKIHFLRGLFDGDGYIKGNQIHLHSVSRKLILQTQSLLASLGATIGFTSAKAGTATFDDKTYNTLPSYQLRGKSKILSEIFDYEYRNDTDSGVTIRDMGDYIMLPVVEINEVDYTGPVFNIETASHTYTANNMAVHNCSEHLEHYHLAPIEFLLKQNDLKLVDARLNDINGGSIQLWATHAESVVYSDTESEKRLFNLRLAEFDRCLDTDAPYVKFRVEVEKMRADLVGLIDKIKDEGCTIHLYGSSTKGNVLIQYVGIDNKIVQYAAERSEGKFGAKTIGTNIKIISEEESRAMLKPGDYYLVTPWHFKKEILEREKKTINEGGIKFIFPLPKVEVIDRV